MNFTPNPLTGDIGVRTNESSIKAAIKLLILTRYYEKPFHSEIGSPVFGLLFENISDTTTITLKEAISGLISQYEPRVGINEIKISYSGDNNRIYIGITFTIKNALQQSSVDIAINRTR